jgi:hypothetical protein
MRPPFLTVTWLCQIVFVMLPDATIARGDNDVFSPLASTTWDMYNIALQPLLLLPALVIVVAVIPRGPELYFPMEKLFTKQLLDSMKEHYAQNEKGSSLIPELNDRIANVTPELSSTVLGSILFLYVRFGSSLFLPMRSTQAERSFVNRLSHYFTEQRSRRPFTSGSFLSYLEA